MAALNRRAKDLYIAVRDTCVQFDRLLEMNPMSVEMLRLYSRFLLQVPTYSFHRTAMHFHLRSPEGYPVHAGVHWHYVGALGLASTCFLQQSASPSSLLLHCSSMRLCLRPLAPFLCGLGLAWR